MILTDGGSNVELCANNCRDGVDALVCANADLNSGVDVSGDIDDDRNVDDARGRIGVDWDERVWTDDDCCDDSGCNTGAVAAGAGAGADDVSDVDDDGVTRGHMYTV